MTGGGFLAHAGRAMAGLVPSPPLPRVTYALLLESAAWVHWTGEALDLLGPEERSRAMRFRFERDRSTYVLAHALWRVLLGRCLGLAATDVPLGFAASGQPQLPGTEWSTSLSHSGTLVLLAAARAGALGVDIERAPASPRLRELATDICSPAELEFLRTVPAEARAHELLRTWTRKEALLKAAGLGLACSPCGFAATTGVPVFLPGAPVTLACVVHDLAPSSAWTGAWAAPPEVRELRWLLLGGCA